MLYPHAMDKELAEMLTVVTRRKQVKGHDNLEQQMAELKEVFAVYDDSGTGQLQQAEFVQAIMSAGQLCYLLRAIQYLLISLEVLSNSSTEMADSYVTGSMVLSKQFWICNCCKSILLCIVAHSLLLWLEPIHRVIVYTGMRQFKK